jgi:hypothetical protein
MNNLKDKHRASSKPEYLVQQQLELGMNQSYSKLLLALNFGLLKQINNQLKTTP